NVRALGLVAEVAQVALFDHLAVILLVDTVQFHGRAVVDEVEQGGEGLAQAHAAAATVAKVEYPLQFLLQRGLVPEVGAFPVDRMARRGLQAALARRLDHAAHAHLRRPAGAAAHARTSCLKRWAAASGPSRSSEAAQIVERFLETVG